MNTSAAGRASGEHSDAVDESNMEGAVVHAQGLTRLFSPSVGVRDVDLVVPRGSIFGFVGPSGSGKTTTVRLLIGADQPDSGTARTLGVDPTSFSARERSRIGYMPQLSVLYDDLSVEQNLRFFSSIYGLRHDPDRQQRALDFVELDGHEASRARSISGGMQRRLSLAAALVHEPELVFLDEPTAGIDPVLRRKIWDRFIELRDQGRTLFVTTQYVGEAAYCDRVGVLSDGELIVVDSPSQLRRRAYGGDLLSVRFVDPPTNALAEDMCGLLSATSERTDYHTIRFVVDDGATRLPELSAWLASQGVEIETAEEIVAPFDDVFVELIEAHRESEGVTNA